MKKYTYLIFICLVIFSTKQTARADFKNDIPNVTPESDKNSTQSMNVNKSNLTKENKKKSTKENKKIKNINSSSNNNSTTQNSGLYGNGLTQHDSNAPVSYKGDYAEGSRKTGIATIIGHVVIIQDDTTLNSNEARLFGRPGLPPIPGSGSSVERAVAIGDVKILKKTGLSTPEIHATGDSVEFLVAKRILILKGNAKVWREKEYLHANEIEISLNTGDIKIKEPLGTINPQVLDDANNKPKKTHLSLEKK